MSERQAKLKRKNEVTNTPVKKKKSALDIVSNIVIVLLILAVLGIGSWAVYSKFSQMPANDATENTVAPTISEYAATEGISVEEFLTKYGLDGVAEVTGDTLISDAMNYMTLGNYAALAGTDAAQIKESMGLGEEYTDDTPMSVIFEAMAAAGETAETENVEAEAE